MKLPLLNIKKPGATGAAIDGDWVNPDDLSDTTVDDFGKTISRYPSGEGKPGTSFVFWITIQPGDYDGNNIVNLTDFGTQKATMSGATCAEGDSDGDSDIDLTDFGALKAKMNVDCTSW